MTERECDLAGRADRHPSMTMSRILMYYSDCSTFLFYDLDRAVVVVAGPIVVSISPITHTQNNSRQFRLLCIRCLLLELNSLIPAPPHLPFCVEMSAILSVCYYRHVTVKLKEN